MLPELVVARVTSCLQVQTASWSDTTYILQSIFFGILMMIFIVRCMNNNNFFLKYLMGLNSAGPNSMLVPIIGQLFSIFFKTG